MPFLQDSAAGPVAGRYRRIYVHHLEKVDQGFRILTKMRRQLVQQLVVRHVELEEAWQGGSLMFGALATFQTETIMRRESGVVWIWSSTCEIWSMRTRLGAGQLRHSYS